MLEYSVGLVDGGVSTLTIFREITPHWELVGNTALATKRITLTLIGGLRTHQITSVLCTGSRFSLCCSSFSCGARCGFRFFTFCFEVVSEFSRCLLVFTIRVTGDVVREIHDFFIGREFVKRWEHLTFFFNRLIELFPHLLIHPLLFRGDLHRLFTNQGLLVKEFSLNSRNGFATLNASSKLLLSSTAISDDRFESASKSLHAFAFSALKTVVRAHRI